jgi:hypothetical protein
MLHAACSLRFCHRHPSPPMVASPAAEFYLFLQLRIHAPWSTPPLVCGVEVNCWPPEHSGAAQSTSTQPTALSLPFLFPRTPLTLVEPPKSSLRVGNHQAASVGSCLLIHAVSSPSGSFVAAVALRFICAALSLPSYLPISMYLLRKPSPPLPALRPRSLFTIRE